MSTATIDGVEYDREQFSEEQEENFVAIQVMEAEMRQARLRHSSMAKAHAVLMRDLKESLAEPAQDRGLISRILGSKLIP